MLRRAHEELMGISELANAELGVTSGEAQVELVVSLVSNQINNQRNKNQDFFIVP